MRRMRVVFAIVLVWLTASSVSAQSRNRYGERGRTVLQGGLGAQVHGSGFTQSREGWGASASVGLVHFVHNNFAVGGSLFGSAWRFRDSGLLNEPVGSRLGADVDVVGHIALSRHLSLRFWSWFGVRHARLPRLQYSSTSWYSEAQVTTEAQLHATLGFSPKFLLHLSSSVALVFGPSVDMYLPLSSNADFDWGLTLGPGVSYSIGAEPTRGQTADEKPVVPKFAQRGRNVLSLGMNIGTRLGGSFGYARFVSDHIAIGPRLFGGARLDDYVSPYWVGGGLQMIAECPLRGRWSMLFLPSIVYRFDRIDRGQHMYNEAAERPGFINSQVTTHELQLTASVLPAFHLFEALVLGVGPTVTEHIRVASSFEILDRAYLSLGLTSFLGGSF